MRPGREITATTLILAFLLAAPLSAAQERPVHLCDFEDLPSATWSDTVYDIPTALKKPAYPSHDYDWNTGGYARIEPSAKIEAYRVKNEDLGKFMKGKYSALVRFTVPSEFRVLDGETDPKSWESGMTLSTETPTRLKITDWSTFASVSIDVYNPEDVEREVFIRIEDSGARKYLRSAKAAKGAATLQIPLKDLDDKRIDVADIRAITVYLDTAGVDKAPELYLDNLQLNPEILAYRAPKADDEEEEFDFEDEEDDEEDEEAIRKYGGRLKQLPLEN